MSKIQSSTDVANVKPEDLPRFLDLFLQEAVRVVNGDLDFGNFNAKLLSVVFSVANTDTTFDHNLGRLPLGYIVTSATAATSVYNGVAANNTSKIILRSSAPATVGLLVF